MAHLDLSCLSQQELTELIHAVAYIPAHTVDLIGALVGNPQITFTFPSQRRERVEQALITAQTECQLPVVRAEYLCHLDSSKG